MANPITSFGSWWLSNAKAAIGWEVQKGLYGCVRDFFMWLRAEGKFWRLSLVDENRRKQIIKEQNLVERSDISPTEYRKQFWRHIYRLALYAAYFGAVFVYGCFFDLTGQLIYFGVVLLSTISILFLRTLSNFYWLLER